jgi:lysyl-tRNA synthetase class 2
MTETTLPPVPAADDNQLIAERREKLKALRVTQADGRGVAFPNDFKPRHRAAALMETHGDTAAEELEAQAISLSVAGRMMLKRVMGKASFATVQDATPTRLSSIGTWAISSAPKAPPSRRGPVNCRSR